MKEKGTTSNQEIIQTKKKPGLIKRTFLGLKTRMQGGSRMKRIAQLSLDNFNELNKTDYDLKDLEKIEGYTQAKEEMQQAKKDDEV